jgi:putative PIG3 family NAD(P)H quinone oxidoreductase
VWTNVFDRAHLAAGETLLVHGGASGVGTTAIQLARAFGACVLATAGNEQKCRACESLGAAAGINYKEEDFVERVMEMTDGHGVDVVLDIVGGDYLERNLRCLAMEGRLVQIAVQRGAKTEVNLLAVMLKRLTITGSTLRPRPIEEKAKIADALRARVWPLLEEGRIKPVIHAKFALADAARAHALMEEGSHIGKIVLEA